MRLRIENYLEQAESALKARKLEDFLRYIGSAEAVIVDSETMARVTCLRAKGLYQLRRFDSALEAIHEALKYRQNEKNYIRLLRSKACIYTYTGKYKESMQLLKTLTTETTDEYLLSEINQNMAWTLLESFKSTPNNALLEEVKIYLDAARDAISTFDNPEKKRLVLTNYAEYFKLKGNYEMAIEMIEEAIKYCSEQQLPKAYNDLAELFLNRGNEDDLKLMERYLHDSEIIANKYDNEFEIAYALYIKGLSKAKTGDFIQVLDSMYIAYNGFMSVGALSYAVECYNLICDVSSSMKDEFLSSMKGNLMKQNKESNYQEVV